MDDLDKLLRDPGGLEGLARGLGQHDPNEGRAIPPPHPKERWLSWLAARAEDIRRLTRALQGKPNALPLTEECQSYSLVFNWDGDRFVVS